MMMVILKGGCLIGSLALLARIIVLVLTVTISLINKRVGKDRNNGVLIECLSE